VRTKQTGAGAISTSVPRDGLVEPRPLPNAPAPAQDAPKRLSGRPRSERCFERFSNIVAHLEMQGTMLTRK
jgi:hypothetical protein